jgi:esterase/lipase superfamily enzyme
MRVNRLNDGSHRFFYVTNRLQENETGPPDQLFGNRRGEGLRFGSFDTKVQTTLGLGMIINSTEWFQNEEINLLNIRSLESEEFVQQLRGFVEASPRRSLLIVVHGFREALDSGLRKTAFVGHVLDINSPVLFFDWPGNQGSALRGYRRARSVARESGAELALTLKLILNEVKPERLWLLANSMGAEVIVSAFSRLYKEVDLADVQTEIDDVVLTAPDVDRAGFNEQFKKEIAALTDQLTVYVSSNDRALLMSRVINRGRRLGESTLDIFNPDQFGEAAGVADLIDPDSELITLVDVTPVNRTRNFHNFSLESPEFFNDLFLRLTNDRTPRHRLIYRVVPPDGPIYWVLTQGR